VIRRIVHVALAACAGGLAAASLRTVGAEDAFEAGLAKAADAETDPAADIPGRVEAYEEAARRDPGESLYALRAAQIRLSRARRRGAAGRDDLAAAERLLAAAALARPLDADVHATHALALRLRRDAAAAAAEARAAVSLAPCGLVALETAQTVGLWAWRAERDPSYLRSALEAGARLDALGRGRETRRAFDAAFAAAGPELAADIAEATSGDDALRQFAESIAAPTNPESGPPAGDGR